MYQLKTQHHFDSAHFLHGYQGKCENLHGHRWKVIVYLSQDELQTEGDERDMVIDFSKFKSAVRELVDSFDHTFIIEDGSLAPETIAALEAESFTLKIVPFRTTAENFAKHFFDELTAQGFAISRVECYETPNNCAIYEGDA